MRELKQGRVVRIRKKKISQYPIKMRIPQEFIKRNDLKIGDELNFYISDAGDLIISKN